MTEMVLLIIAGLVSAFNTYTKTEEPKVVTEVKVIEVPAVMFEPCFTTPPVDKMKYLEYNEDERKAFLVDYNIKLLGDVKNCNSKLQSIKEHQTKQLELIKK
jgi:hypothetical protein